MKNLINKTLSIPYTLKNSIIKTLPKNRNKTNIVFYCVHPQYYEEFKNVHKLLPEVKIVVVNPPWKEKAESIKLTTDFLDKNNIQYEVGFHSPIDFLINILHTTPLDNNQLYKYIHLKTKFIRMMYTVIDKNIIHSSTNSIYDLILTPGNLSKKKLSRFSKCVTIGFPKYDDYFKNEIDKKIIANKLGLENNKKTILYAPTWGEQSTVDEYEEAIKKLSRNYNIIFKPHGRTRVDIKERYRIEFFRNSPVIVADNIYSLAPLFSVSDVVITDYSGTIYEAAACDIPVVLLEKHMDKRIRFYSPDNIEQKARDLGMRVSNPLKLNEAIEKTLRNPLEFKKKRKKYADRLISYRDGTSAVRAANAIKDFIDNN